MSNPNLGKFTIGILNMRNFTLGKLIHTLGNCTLVNFSLGNPIPGNYIYQSLIYPRFSYLFPE